MLSVTTTKDVILTGIREISEALGGGIRIGSLVLIEGEPETGKSVLSQHFAHGALRSKGNAVAYYTTDHSIKSLIAQMNSLSLYATDDFLADWLRIYPLSYGFEDTTKPLHLLIHHISALPERFNLIIVDSITPLMTQIKPVSKMDFFYACKELCQQERTIILVTNPHSFEKGAISRVHALCDDCLRLRSGDAMFGEEQVDHRLIKILEVPKLHGAECQTREISFEIKPKVGIQILPLVKARV